MSVSFGPKLGLIINALTGDTWDVALRALLRALDQLPFLRVINRTTTAPPGSPANGAAYIVGVGGSGAWSGHDLSLAVWSTDNPAAPSGEWEFYVPAPGWLAYSIADAAFYSYSGTAWAAFSAGGSSTLAGDSDVAISSPANLDLLTYNTTSGKWENLPAAGGGGGASVNNQRASYTAVLGDANNIVTMNVAAANNFTVPPNSAVAFPIGTTLSIIQSGAGQTTLVPGTGVTIQNPSSLTARAQWSTISVTKLATDTWVAAGDLT